MTFTYLAQRWNQTIATLRPKSLAFSVDLFSEVLRCYSEPLRTYHNVKHLEQGFKVLDEVMAKLPGIGAVELAFWLHDIVYSPGSPHNEELSAVFTGQATLSLGFDPSFALQVANLVRATTHKHEPQTREAQVLLDVDLSILAAPQLDYDAYEANIRQEYLQFSDEQYKAGRSKFLRSMLDRERIFSTPELRSGYEGRARANMSRSLSALEAS